MIRVANKIPMKHLDFTKYEAEKPEGNYFDRQDLFSLGPLEKDIQAWRKSVTNAKIQLEYQDDRLMNLELADSHGGPVWLHSNSASEGNDEFKLI